MSGKADFPSSPGSDGELAVLAFVSDIDSVEALKAGLQGLPGGIDLRRGTIRQAIRFLEKEAPPRAIVVDVSDVENAQAALDDLARICPPAVQVFAVGDNTDINFYRLLVDDVGVTEYLPKPLTRDSVQRQLLNRLTNAGPDQAAPRGGQVIAVCGARGGVGTTTVAVGLAMELAGVAKGHVAMLDLHIQGGSMALMLAGTPGGGLRMALEDGDRADSLFLERTAIQVAPRLQMIAADEPLDAELRLTRLGVSRLVALLQRKFNYVVIDLPMPMPPLMEAALEAARHVAVVMMPDLLSLHGAKAITAWVDTAGGGTRRAITVLNRADGKGGLARPLLEKALGGKPDIVIPELGAKMVEAINLGVPAVRHVPALRRHLLPLVREVAGVTPGAGGGSWVRRMFRG